MKKYLFIILTASLLSGCATYWNLPPGKTEADFNQENYTGSEKFDLFFDGHFLE